MEGQTLENVLHLGYYNKDTIDGWLKHLFPTVREAGKSKIKTQADSVPDEPSSWITDDCLLAVSSHGTKGKRALRGLFHKGTNPTHEGSTTMT